jgi:hypothetical protein
MSSSIRSHLRAGLFATVAACALTACAPHSEYMRDAASPSSAKAPPDQALVIFVRPGSMAYLAGYQVVDDKGVFLGESLANSHFAALVPPGDHIFVAFHDWDPIARNDAMRARLLPGRTYYVKVQPGMTGVDILAITPRTESWSQLTTWLQETKELVPDRAAGQRYMDEHRDDVKEEITSGIKHLSDDDEEDLADRTLLATDGLP